MRDVRLPGSLTSLSIDGLMLDTDCWNWEAIPDTLHSIHLADIHIASRSHLTWLQQLSSIQVVSMQCSFFHCDNEDLYSCLECLICTPNLRSVALQVEYGENTVSVLRALSRLTSLSTLNLNKVQDPHDPQLGCCPGYWLMSLTSVTDLLLWNLPASVCADAVRMTWLSALSVFTQGHQFVSASTLASLTDLTRLNSLNLKSPALGNIQLTFLHSLADLANCVLDAHQYDVQALEHHFRDLRHGFQAMVGLSALTFLSLSASFPLGPDPKLSALALNTNLQCLEYFSLHLVSSYFIKTVAELTCLTHLSLSGS